MNGPPEGGGGGQARTTINQDLDLIKSCIEVTRVAARRAAVLDKDGRGAGATEKDDYVLNALGAEISQKFSPIDTEGCKGGGDHPLQLLSGRFPFFIKG